MNAPNAPCLHGRSAGNLVSMSEQQFADCDTTDVGCNEGLMDFTSAFAEKNTVCTEGNYLYTVQDGTCNSSGFRVGAPRGGVVGSIDMSNDINSALEATRVYRH